MIADTCGAADAGFEKIAHLLWRVGDMDIGPEEVRQLTDEMSRLLWDISALGYSLSEPADLSGHEARHEEWDELTSSHRADR
ncbi:hypothetical protein [Microvirga zambiensis]|uniref:hypothetical protein n=1 Tax=Microvirga zambiensis TaxID=1402137 RepID=UPI00191EDA6E|nr:hypothetical protein [Microvirga zambiensis]